MSRPYKPRFNQRRGPRFRVDGKIRAREVRVIGVDNQQIGVRSLGEAISLARASGVNLVEVAPAASPPVCRLVEYGRYIYELEKKEKASKKHQHANKVKEVQLSARIDSHDFSIKVAHAVGFLCEEMKVKASLRFRGREMAHTEVGFRVMEKFTKELEPFGQPDFRPKLMGRSINLMFSPLPRNKRAKNPYAEKSEEGETGDEEGGRKLPASGPAEEVSPNATPEPSPREFQNNPFNKL